MPAPPSRPLHFGLMGTLVPTPGDPGKREAGGGRKGRVRVGWSSGGGHGEAGGETQGDDLGGRRREGKKPRGNNNGGKREAWHSEKKNGEGHW